MIYMIDEILSGKVKKASFKGWVYRKREQKDAIFLIIRDSTGIIQCVIKKGDKSWKKAQKVTIESSVEITGTAKKDKRAPGGHEIKVDTLKIIGLAEIYPISRDLSTEFLRDVRHLWLRSRKITTLIKISSKVSELVHSWFRKQGYTEIHPPMFVSGACEGGSTLFEVEYFGKKAFLTQSWQLYAEAIAHAIEKIYTIAPSFRAEKSHTSRHVTEFWHIEMEQAHATMKDIMKVEEDLVLHVLKGVAKECKKELEILKVKIDIPKKPFPKITFDEAVKRLKAKGFKIGPEDDLGADEEKALAKEFKGPVFVYDYPRKIKAFYCKAYKDKPDYVMSTDLIVPRIGEISTGGSRVDDKKELIKRMKEFGLDRKDYEWYIDLRKYGSVPHAGFGMGIERLIAWMLKLDSIYDVLPFPRTPKRLYP